MAKKTGVSKKKTVKVEPVGQAHIHASFNNIIVTLTNNAGQVISWSSAGKQGFKSSFGHGIFEFRHFPLPC